MARGGGCIGFTINIVAILFKSFDSSQVFLSSILLSAVHHTIEVNIGQISYSMSCRRNYE